MRREFMLFAMLAIALGVAATYAIANGKLTPCPERGDLCEEGQALYSQNGRFFFCLDVEKTSIPKMTASR